MFPPCISQASHAIIDTNTNEYLSCMKIFVYVELTILQYVTFYKGKKKRISEDVSTTTQL